MMGSSAINSEEGLRHWAQKCLPPQALGVVLGPFALCHMTFYEDAGIEGKLKTITSVKKLELHGEREATSLASMQSSIPLGLGGGGK